jgi:hypothetical protein
MRVHRLSYLSGSLWRFCIDTVIKLRIRAAFRQQADVWAVKPLLGRRAGVVIRPPARLPWRHIERDDSQPREKRIRIVRLDAHRPFAEVAMLGRARVTGVLTPH